LSVQPSAAIIERLSQIWQRVLQRSPIGPDENFFDLSGRDEMADMIFAGIAQDLGRELPTATICYAPTIAALAGVVLQPTLPHFSPFVPLKAGTQESPILITHGVGGRASFSKLAKHIQTKHAIYGIQAKGVDGIEQPFEHIEDMAQFYLQALKEVQSKGPYILIGYSFGGLVALEMAQHLSSNGETIALLTLIDTYPDPRYFPLGQRAWLAAKKAKGHLSSMRRMPMRNALEYLARGLKRRWLGSSDNRQAAAAQGRLSFAQTTAQVRESDFRAMARYQPKFYEGKIRFVKPETNSYLPNNPTALWRPLVADLEVETVPGDHLGMIGEHFESLAAVLTRYVQESDIVTSV